MHICKYKSNICKFNGIEEGGFPLNKQFLNWYWQRNNRIMIKVWYSPNKIA